MALQPLFIRGWKQLSAYDAHTLNIRHLSFNYLVVEIFASIGKMV